MSILGLDPGDPNNWYQSPRSNLGEVWFAPDDPSLPPPWKGVIDGNTGRLYYWNLETNITQYEKPAYWVPSSCSPASFSHSPVTASSDYTCHSQYPNFYPQYHRPAETVINGFKFAQQFPFPNPTNTSTTQPIYAQSQSVVEPIYPAFRSFQPEYAMNPSIPTFQSPSVPTFLPHLQFPNPFPSSGVGSSTTPTATTAASTPAFGSTLSQPRFSSTPSQTLFDSSLSPTISDVPVQKEVLRSTAALSALIDKLEKLHQPLYIAVTEEVNLVGESTASDQYQAKQDVTVEGNDDLMRDDKDDEIAQVDDEDREREQNVECSQVDEMSVHVSSSNGEPEATGFVGDIPLDIPVMEVNLAGINESTHDVDSNASLGSQTCGGLENQTLEINVGIQISDDVLMREYVLPAEVSVNTENGLSLIEMAIDLENIGVSVIGPLVVEALSGHFDKAKGVLYNVIKYSFDCTMITDSGFLNLIAGDEYYKVQLKSRKVLVQMLEKWKSKVTVEIAGEENTKKPNFVLREGLKLENKMAVRSIDTQFRSHLLLWFILSFELRNCETVKETPPYCRKASAEISQGTQTLVSQVFTTIISSHQYFRASFYGVLCNLIKLYNVIYIAFINNAGNLLPDYSFGIMVRNAKLFYEYMNVLAKILLRSVSKERLMSSNVSIMDTIVAALCGESITMDGVVNSFLIWLLAIHSTKFKREAASILHIWAYHINDQMVDWDVVHALMYEEGFIIEFVEKPKDKKFEALIDGATNLGIDDLNTQETPYLTTVDIYVLYRKVMSHMLQVKFSDFGTAVVQGATYISLKVKVYMVVGCCKEIVHTWLSKFPAVQFCSLSDDALGDIAGMESDLFSSYAESFCAALVVASISSFVIHHEFTIMLYPLLVSSMGILVCEITTLFATNFFEIKPVEDIELALKKQLIISTVLITIGIAIDSWVALPSSFTIYSIGVKNVAKNCLIEDFNCAFQENILTQGHMYLFIHYICLYSNILRYETKKIIPFQEVTSVREVKTAGIFPNAIEEVLLQMVGDKKYSFARDGAYRIINDVWLQYVDGAIVTTAQLESISENQGNGVVIEKMESSNRLFKELDVTDRNIITHLSKDSELPRKVEDTDCYWKWFASNLASGGASSLLFVYSLYYACTHLARDSKATKKGGERQFNGLVDVYRKTLKSDGIAGLYHGSIISCVEAIMVIKAMPERRLVSPEVLGVHFLFLTCF